LICSEKFDSAEEIYEHGFSCQAFVSYPISCVECFEKLSHDINVLKEHDKFHRSKFFCDLCDTIFTDRTKFNLHLTKVHNERVSRRPVCRYCEMIFPNEEERNKHIIEEHQDLKNKHQSRSSLGRMVCEEEGCTFSTNSEILFQNHFRKHFGNIDIDSYYQAKIKTEDEIIENLVSKPRKRGRPRLCDEINNSGYTTIFTNNSSENNSVKRKRGRPRKNEQAENIFPIGIILITSFI